MKIKKILSLFFVVLSIFTIVMKPRNVYAADIQQRVYATEMTVGSYGTISMAFIYDYNPDTKKKTFVKWSNYKVKPVNGSTCWYISRTVKQNGNGLKMTVTAQGYNYNTRETSEVYKFIRTI